MCVENAQQCRGFAGGISRSWRRHSYEEADFLKLREWLSTYKGLCCDNSGAFQIWRHSQTLFAKFEEIDPGHVSPVVWGGVASWFRYEVSELRFPNESCSCYPFGEKSTPRMDFKWPSRNMIQRPVLRSHTLPNASKPLKSQGNCQNMQRQNTASCSEGTRAS